MPVNLKHHPSWLTPDGEWIACPNWEHAYEASKRFPDSTDPECAAIHAGWLKIYGNGFIGKPLTGLQKEALECAHQNSRLIEEEAVEGLRYQQSMRAAR